MSITEHLMGVLDQRGLSDEEKRQVLEILKTQQPTMKGRWDEEVSGYSAGIIQTLERHALSCALLWINKNCPNHRARELFL